MAYKSLNGDSSEKFEDLDEELETLCEDIKSCINERIPRLDGGDRIRMEYF